MASRKGRSPSDATTCRIQFAFYLGKPRSCRVALSQWPREGVASAQYLAISGNGMRIDCGGAGVVGLLFAVS